jgi:hypothetical protein
MPNSLLSDPLAFGMYYCPEHFRDKSPDFHVHIIRAALANQYLAVVAPRGSSKSTLLTFLIPLWSICARRCRYIIILQSTFEKASTSIATIADEIRDNDDLKSAFGVKLERDSRGDMIFVHPPQAGEASGWRTRVLGKGADQIVKVRGEKFGAYRPDLILIDDLEDDVTSRNKDLREQLRMDFNRAVLPAVDPKKHQIIAIGTIFHDDSLISRLVNPDYFPKFKKLFFTARYKDPVTNIETSIWPERWSLDELKELETEDPNVFATEMMNDPASGDMSKFKKSDFRYWRMRENEYILYDDTDTVCAKGKMTDCKWAVACDLAWEERRDSDFSVILPGFLTPNSEILLDEYTCVKGLRPDQMFEILFPMVKRLTQLTKEPGPVGFEKAKLEKVVKWLMEKEMRRRNEFIWLKDVLWDADKLQRIYTRLQPRYAQHVIYHRHGMTELEYQLMRIPHGTHDDLPDAAQSLVQLLVYPKVEKKEPAKKNAEDEFNWWREKAKSWQHPQKQVYRFGQKNKPVNIPAQESFR